MLSASEASFSQWGTIQIYLPLPLSFCSERVCIRIGSTTSVVRDISADVVSVCGPSDTSSALKLFAPDEVPRGGGSSKPGHLMYGTGDRSRSPATADLVRRPRVFCEGPPHVSGVAETSGDRSRTSSPKLIVCKHLDDDEDADGDEENDDSDCSGIAGPG